MLLAACPSASSWYRNAHLLLVACAGALLSLCFVAQAYDHAVDIVHAFADLPFGAELLVQVRQQGSRAGQVANQEVWRPLCNDCMQGFKLGTPCLRCHASPYLPILPSARPSWFTSKYGSRIWRT